MAYSVEIIYSKNTDYSEPQTVTETGLPTSIDIENLDVETTYYVKALLKNDGVIEDEDNDKFTTLSAGTIALTHQSSAREGDNYVVVYTYTSTYALSSSILRCGETIASQGVIAGNTITYTVSGLTAGVEYTCEITTIDIYTGTNVYTDTLTMPIVNKIDIINTFPSETEVEVELEYTVDGGFGSGWVDYWLDVDDPSTDQPQGHETFRNGDETCTVTGLTAGTTYLFKATILLDDGTTEISSSVVSASTVTDYNTKYLRISNRGTTQSTLYIKNYTPSPTYDCPNWNNCYTEPEPLYYGGTSWYSKKLNAADITITNISAGYGTYLKHNGSMSGSYYSNRERLIPFSFYTSGSNEFSVSGNLNSLINGDDFQTKFTTYQGQWAHLFYKWTSLTDISNLNVGVTTIPVNGMTMMFYGCTGLTKGLDLRKVTMGESGSFDNMYEGCTSLTEVYAPNISEWDTGMFYKWLNNVAPTGVVYKPAGLEIPTDSVSGIPSGWTTQDY